MKYKAEKKASPTTRLLSHASPWSRYIHSFEPIAHDQRLFEGVNSTIERTAASCDFQGGGNTEGTWDYDLPIPSPCIQGFEGSTSSVEHRMCASQGEREIQRGSGRPGFPQAQTVLSRATGAGETSYNGPIPDVPVQGSPSRRCRLRRRSPHRRSRSRTASPALSRGEGRRNRRITVTKTSLGTSKGQVRSRVILESKA